MSVSTLSAASNEYLDVFEREIADLAFDEFGLPDFSDVDVQTHVDNMVRLHAARDFCVQHYAWAVPNDQALETIAALSPIVEVGAGSGYWTMLLRQRGATVVPYDRFPYPLLNRQVTHSWVPISRGGPSAALAGPRAHHTLLLSWPSYGDPWPAQALDRHRGEHVVYIGEGPGGCTGDDRFHELLEDRYEQIAAVSIPRWWMVRDDLTVWRRRP